jgi:SpoVK/Ycf46/Vps4 family AAA+-type ATPase
MLFHGAPGTGKSALAEEIARRHGRPTVVRAASQLLSKYVGGTERNLAAAFTEAASRKALLILDEADSFLQPRRAAQRAWEVSQVNELLVQIERFEGWLVCTTNFLEGLDEAALRRFALKVRFEPPDATQRLALVRAASDALGLPWTGDDDARVPRLLTQATELTPGDVAAVVEQVQLLGGIEGPTALAERLVRETSLRRRPGGRVGFG